MHLSKWRDHGPNGKQAKRETISSASNISCPAQTELSKLVVGQLGGGGGGGGEGGGWGW